MNRTDFDNEKLINAYRNADVMEAKNLAAIEQHISVINNITREIKKNQLLKKLLDSSDISLKSKYKIRNKEFR